MDKTEMIKNAQYISETSVKENQMEECISDGPSFNSSVCEFSDEEISTRKEKHLRLGPEDLNDTIPCEF